MAKNVFISFRYKDGIRYKDKLASMFDSYYDTVDYSENQDRSMMSDSTIRQYLYSKLRRSSVTIVILTPFAVTHQKSWNGYYNDWIYDEIRYSLENRENNATNGLIAVYTPEAKDMLISDGTDSTIHINQFDNLCRKNMMNVKPEYKINPNPDIYDRDYDSYCSLLSWDEFTGNIGRYIDIARAKRDEQYKYDIVKRM